MSTVGKTVVESESAGSFAPITSTASLCAGLQGEQAPAASPERFHLVTVSCSRRPEGRGKRRIFRLVGRPRRACVRGYSRSGLSTPSSPWPKTTPQSYPAPSRKALPHSAVSPREFTRASRRITVPPLQPVPPACFPGRPVFAANPPGPCGNPPPARATPQPSGGAVPRHPGIPKDPVPS